MAPGRGIAFAIALSLVAGLTPAPAAGSADATGRRTVIIGRSVDRRPIVATETGDLDEPRKTLVVGCVHGNECAGIAVADRLAGGRPPAREDLWIVRNLNPDGAAAGTRGNAHGVDLNRNFPWRWRPLGGPFYSGRHPLSEPESRAAYRLILRVHPAISVWFHQHLGVVDESGGSLAVERRFATETGMRLARLTREPGSAVGWENHRIRSGTAFVVELRVGSLSSAVAVRVARAIVSVSDAPLSRRPGTRP